ncbi:hypothetical protein GCM10009789_21410 [Kribbella sancticallisti]|uniref:Uncharacterized protein n=1 Tax=Kribbella sancticallisti TaxID=460087 RepID=A0ABN2CZW5_9ACTN
MAHLRQGPARQSPSQAGQVSTSPSQDEQRIADCAGADSEDRRRSQNHLKTCRITVLPSVPAPAPRRPGR